MNILLIEIEFVRAFVAEVPAIAAWYFVQMLAFVAAYRIGPRR